MNLFSKRIHMAVVSLRHHMSKRSDHHKKLSVVLAKLSSSHSFATDAAEQEVLSRVKNIADEEECASVVRHMLKLGQPIGVDMEGIQLPTLGLVQVKDVEGNIYLFRTGRNKRLFKEGGLKELLENPTIVKVMHASTGDCISIYKEGVQMWGLYDTALAHKVIEYQKLGRSTGSETMGFNSICELYGMTVNPMKEKMHGILWQKENLFITKEVLPPDMLYYAAADVEPLLELYEITKSLIDPDFLPLMHDLCENELVRQIDPELIKLKRRLRVKVESSDLFLYNLKPGVTKGDIYDVFARQEGYKKVLFSQDNGTAHVLMSKRELAVLTNRFCQTDSAKAKLGGNFNSSLVIDLKASEIEESVLYNQKYQETLKQENFIVDKKVMAAVVDIMLQCKIPLVLDFHMMTTGTTMEVFVGRQPPMKFDLTKETITQGKLGQLLAARDVPKIVGRIDASNVYNGLRMCSSLEYVPANFFDVTSGYKAVDYLNCGQSMYKVTPLPTKQVAASLGINLGNKLEGLLFVYLHLKQILPKPVWQFLEAKAQVDLQIGANISVPVAKEARKQLKLKYETECLHITCLDGPAEKIEAVLNEYFESRDVKTKRIICSGSNALVQLHSHPQIKTVTKELRPKVIDGLLLKATDVDLKELSNKETIKPVNVVQLHKLNSANMEVLSELGLFQLLGMDDDNDDLDTLRKHELRYVLPTLNLDEFKSIHR